VDNDIVTGNPVDGSGDAVLVTGLKAVQDTENLGAVTTCGCRVGQNKTNGLLGINDEDGADGECNALLVDVGGVLVVDPGSWSDLRYLDTATTKKPTCRMPEQPEGPCLL
jgi:hypothetical protein